MRALKPLFLQLAIIMVIWPTVSIAKEITILTSIKPVYMLVYAITHGVSEPELLVPSIVSPHDYQLRPSDYRQLKSSNVIVWFGPELEPFLQKSIQNIENDVMIIELLRSPQLTKLPLRDHKHNHHHEESNHAEPTKPAVFDPHVWLNPNNARAIATYISQELSREDSKNAVTYQDNLASFLQQMDALDDYVRQNLSEYGQGNFMVLHDAYQYLEQYTGLKNSGVIAINPEVKPGVKHVLSLRRKLAENNIQCIFAEPQFNDGVVNQLIGDNKTNKVWLDPLAGHIAKSADAYSLFIIDMVGHIKKCMK